ncbi:adenosylcobinamide-phosphate synthase CbiB [Merdimmobilis hominis]|jgi:adenosylcobinamide-phosphate synthase|uniref:adenosylcobinamide-phosphate synthase CbiB n=1 Tax=Merdimmobilis hominis TaxID=2897707 RepID=UPI0008F88C0A|nr:adenosylcobinamide-phosphate synthase CbiB [Merdimmobilis hominis]PWL56884.1 MAG: cobalamin biosynthesis protein CobD [Oscillospiraceae bacterium]PWL56894.1 MAG: cobalamin biosynthesis protein CobD [Oscillospiraceae bacterium]
MLYHTAALAAGFLLDQILGDPRWMPHPVRAMGWCIQRGEALLRRAFPQTPGGERLAGAVLALSLPVGTFFLAAGAICLAGWVHPLAGFLLEAFWCNQILAAKGLRQESGLVYDALKRGDLEGARKAVSMIVGRDTQHLDETGVTKAAVETVAENTSDGVVAPLLFAAIGGAPLGLAYKAVNTLDSMIGYKNDAYLHFGRFAARQDDLWNFLPARISGVAMVLAAYLLGFDGKNAARIFCRDRLCHKSPNSAHTEAACAGALDIQLAGDAYYFGVLHHKPTIGDPLRPVEAEDIPRAGRLMNAAAVLILTAVVLIRMCLYFM